jgi:hypothetical protein
MVDISTKLAGTSRLLRGTFYTGGENTKASLTTTLSTANANLTLEAKTAGVGGNDISLRYIDTGLETTDFKLETVNDQDIVATLERTHSRASFETTNEADDANVKFVAASAGTAGNSISITLTSNTDTPIVVSSCAISTKVVTLTTATAHGYSAGDVIGVSGFLDEETINGCHQIASVETNTITFSLSDALTATSATGYGVVSKLAISVSGSDITVASPQSSSGYPMITPTALVLAWGRTASAKALATCEILGDTGDKRIGYISKRYLVGGRASAVTTTALDIKREIEKSAVAKLLVDVFVPGATTGMGVLSAMEKTYLTGGSNLVRIDPDDNAVTVVIYDTWENVLTTIDPEDVTRTAMGVYECVYAPDPKYRSICVEFSCTISGETVLSRHKIDLEWAISDTVGVT